LHHPEQVARVVGVGEHVQLNGKVGAFDLVVYKAQGREVLDCKADRVKQGDLLVVATAVGFAPHDLPELDNGVIIVKLLDFTLDAGLRRIFDENVRAQQDITVQLGFAWAVTADGVDVLAAAYHIVGQDCCVLLVCGAGGDDINAHDCVFAGCASGDIEALGF